MAQFDLTTQTTAGTSTPAAGRTTVFIDSTTKQLKSKDDAGTVTDYGAPGNAITDLTGEVTATGPGSAAATVTNAAVIAKLLTGYSAASGTITSSDSILSAFNKLGARLNCGWFGSGADGPVTIAVNTTLTRDMYYTTLAVDSGVTLTTAGFRIHALESVTVTGTIDRSGNDGSGITAGAALTAGTLGAASTGGAGGTAAGVAGTASATALGSAGGIGGTGSGGAGGAGGGANVVAATVGGVEAVQSARQAVVGQTTGGTAFTGGGGGGGGGGDGTAGGGGGGGGGVLMIATRTLSGAGAIRAHGGNGGTPVAGNRGGGAGGGGGAIILVTENDTTATSLTVDVSGGLGSSGTGSGTTGANGSVGRIVRVRV